jgi:muramoyltetrapeptide carboxypeptidase
LRAGAEVGVFALSGPVPAGRLARGARLLEDEGLRVVEAANVRSRSDYLAGDDDERVAGIEDLLDRGVEALVASRGGYGVARVLDRLPWERLAQWGGWIVGFSDVTALHSGMAVRSTFATLHGPMLSSLARHEGAAHRLVGWLCGRRYDVLFRLTPAQVVRRGRARGVGIGGNLSLLCSLVGTPFEPDFRGAVLFLEDVGEPLYRLDRMLTHLRLASRLDEVAAVVVGRCAGCGAREVGWRSRWRRVLAESVPASAVIVEGLPFGHGRINLPFPLGVEIGVDTDRLQVSCGG